jgi:pimeloyl-ACP methyl ester carboxylesterase
MFFRTALSCIAIVACVSAQVRAAGPASHTFIAKGVKIHYLVQGAGEPVVLIHGLYSNAAINWQMPGIVAALAREQRVIALDMPGHGHSDKREQADAYGPRLVEDVILLLDHLKIKKAHIVGYSMGGVIAGKLIAQHPDRVLSGVLGGMGWLREGGGLQKVWATLPVRDGGRTPPACVHGIAALALTKEDLQAIKVPMLVLIGDRDPVKNMYVTPLRSVRKDWPVIEIADAGHFDCIMKKAFADEIVKWLAQHGKSAAARAPGTGR